MIGLAGASGRLGRLIVAELARRAPGRVLALSRHRPPSLPEEVPWRPLDYDDLGGAPASLHGVGTLLLIASNAPDPVRRVQHRAVLESAARSGATRLAYTSLTGVEARDTGVDELHRDTEAAMVDTGLPWLALRNAEYTENWADSAHEHLQGGAVTMDLHPDTSIASATRADLAAASAALLLTPDVSGRAVDLAGPVAWTPTDYARTLAALTERPLPYRRHDRDRQMSIWRRRGRPDHVVDLLTDVHRTADQGAFAATAPTIPAAIGRPAQTLEDALAASLARTGAPLGVTRAPGRAVP